jgi:hypothetical protein
MHIDLLKETWFLWSVTSSLPTACEFFDKLLTQKIFIDFTPSNHQEVKIVADLLLREESRSTEHV